MQTGDEQQQLNEDLFILASTPRGVQTQKDVEEVLAKGADPNACCNIFGNTPLHETANFDNADAAVALVAGGAEIDVKNSNGDTPLHLAGCGGAERVAKILIDAGADPNALNDFGETPLICAVGAGSVKITKILLDAGTDPSTRTNTGVTALDAICDKECTEGALEKITDLLNNKPQKKKQKPEEGTPPSERSQEQLDKDLISLAEQPADPSTQATVAELLAAGANPDACCTPVGGTVLHASTEHDNEIVAAAVIEAGADVNAEDRLSDTPLHIVSVFNSMKVAELLIANGANLSALDDIGETPLHHAAEFGKPEIAKLMLDAGADTSIKSFEGETAEELICGVPCPPDIETALKQLFFEAKSAPSPRKKELEKELVSLAGKPISSSTEADLEDLLSEGASPDSCCNKFGGTALHETAANDNHVAALVLTEAGADVNRNDRLGDTPLHFAAITNAVGVARVLLDAGADVNATDSLGETPLHRASALGNVAIAEVLLLFGAETRTKNNKGKTAAEIVCAIPCTKSVENRFKDLFPEQLKQKKRRNRKKRSHVEEAEGTEDGKRRKKERKGSKKTKGKFDKGLMKLADTAVNASTKASVMKILSKGANPNACCNTFGGTALHLSTNFDNYIVASALIAAGADVDAKDSIGDTPLHDAAIVNAHRVTKLLIEAGANVDVIDDILETPLHHAFEWGSVDVAKLLLNAGANFLLVSKKGETAVDLTCKRSCPGNAREELAKLLPARGGQASGSRSPFVPIPSGQGQSNESADPQQLNKELLELANTKVNKTTALLVSGLLQKGADPNACCSESNGTALHEAADLNNFIVASALVARGAHLDARDALGDTPLHSAAITDANKVARVLIRAGADLDARNKKGATPLHKAAMWGSADTAAVLISLGADASLKDDGRGTAADVICIAACLEMQDSERLKKLLT